MHRWHTASGAMQLAVFLLLGLCTAQLRAGTINADGLHHEPWFLESFLELKDDWVTARDAGRHFVVLWELKGCSACARLHADIFSQPDVASAFQADFDVLQLNIIGARKTQDFDGTTRGESDLARAHGVEATPTLQFFSQSAAGQAPREIMRIQGVPDLQEMLLRLQFVASRAYETESFDLFLQRQGGAQPQPRSPLI